MQADGDYEQMLLARLRVRFCIKRTAAAGASRSEGAPPVPHSPNNKSNPFSLVLPTSNPTATMEPADSSAK